MQIQSENLGQVMVLRLLNSRLDSATAHDFKSKMVDFVLQGYLYLALDLSQVEFMDSSGLSALLSTIKTMQGRGRLVVFGVGRNVAQLFSLTRLDRGVIEIHPDQETALQALNPAD